MGVIQPKKLWAGDVPKLTHTGILLSIFETVKWVNLSPLYTAKMCSKITSVSLCKWQKAISLWKCTKGFWRRPSPGPAGGAYSALPDHLVRPTVWVKKNPPAVFRHFDVRLSELTVKIWMKIDLYCQRQRCSPITLVSVNIRFVPIFEGFIGERASNDSGIIENMDFHFFRRYVFSTLRNETNVIIYCYLIPCRLSTDPEIFDLGWLNDLNVHYTSQYCDLRSCFQRSGTARDSHRSAGSGV